MARPQSRAFIQGIENIALDPNHTPQERSAAMNLLATYAKIRLEARKLKLLEAQPGPTPGSPAQPNQTEQAALTRLSALAASLRETGEI
ncbi:MAG: hypothetical protein WB676_03430 [Bryobacteraceae bacterium]